jgi:hypothetical protein
MAEETCVVAILALVNQNSREVGSRTLEDHDHGSRATSLVGNDKNGHPFVNR